MSYKYALASLRLSGRETMLIVGLAVVIFRASGSNKEQRPVSAGHLGKSENLYPHWF